MNEQSKHLVYGLIDPRTNELRYIGKSSRGLKRPKLHRQPKYRIGKTHRRMWLMSMWEDNETVPSVLVLKECQSESEALEQEVILIAFFKQTGIDLTNGTDGGDGISGHKMTEDTRAKMSKSKLGVKFSPEHCSNMGKAKLGKKHTVEAREHMRIAHLGQKPSPKAIEKSLQAHLGSKMSPEAKEKMRKAKIGNTWNRGRKQSPEAIEKMRKGRTGMKFSPQHCENIRRARMGAKASPEAIANMKLPELKEQTNYQRSRLFRRSTQETTNQKCVICGTPTN